MDGGKDWQGLYDETALGEPAVEIRARQRRGARSLLQLAFENKVVQKKQACVILTMYPHLGL
jgi:hypothetical protein